MHLDERKMLLYLIKKEVKIQNRRTKQLRLRAFHLSKEKQAGRWKTKKYHKVLTK